MHGFGAENEKKVSPRRLPVQWGSCTDNRVGIQGGRWDRTVNFDGRFFHAFLHIQEKHFDSDQQAGLSPKGPLDVSKEK